MNTDRTNQFLPYSTADIGDALAPYFAARAGGPMPDDPVALDLLNRGWPLTKIASHYVTGSGGEAPAQTLARALGTSDLGNDLVTGLAAVAYTAADVAMAGWLKILRRVPVQNFHAASVPHLSVSDLRLMPEFSDWPVGVLTAGGVLESLALESYGLLLVLTRQAMINDEVGQAASAFEALGNAASLNVSARLAVLLEDTANLSDGAAFFNSTAGNLVASSALSITTLEAAINTLYRQATPTGPISGVAMKYIIAPPQLSMIAQALLTQVYGNASASPIEVITCPHLSSASTWYVCGAPQSAPCLALLTLGAQPTARTLLIEKTLPPVGREGIGMAVRNDFRLVRTSRIGIVKITA